VNAARLTSAKGSSSWPTISVNESKNSVGKSQEHRNSIPLGTMAVMQSWPTPNAQVLQDGESPETWLKRKEAMKAKGYNGNGCGTPLTIAVQLHGQAPPASSSSLGSRQGLSWATPQAHDAQGPKTPEQIAVMRAKGHGVKNLNEQACWGTPTARDHKSGRGNEDRQYKELTPMVERAQAGKLNQNWVCCLMGVPMGWVDPMCPVSVIKNWPRFVTGWLRAQTAQIPSGFSEMELSLPLQSERSEFSLASWPSPRLNENQQTEELGLLWAENGFKQPKTRGGKARANGSTFDVTLETAARGVAAMEATT
jgi:hypothetical protein